MIFRVLRRIGRGQVGLTLIEAVTALAVTGIIGLGAATATGQVLTHTARNSDYNTASQYAMNAVYWLCRDAQMAQTVDTEGASGFPVTLGWTEWDNSEHEVVYSIEDGSLVRSHSTDGGEPTETLVARCINSVSENTTCVYDDRVLAIRVTATVNEGANALSVTKVREIVPRPNL
jgi:Tfp pilus assembly protein PilV